MGSSARSKQCGSVELVWGTRCEMPAGHEAGKSASERVHVGRRTGRNGLETLRWGEPADMREVADG